MIRAIHFKKEKYCVLFCVWYFFLKGNILVFSNTTAAFWFFFVFFNVTLSQQLVVLLCEKCRSNTFFYSFFKQIMFGLQFRYQRAANKVLLYFL